MKEVTDKSPVLHRYNFNPGRAEMKRTRRDDLLAGDKNFMQFICENSTPFEYEDLMKLASEGKVRRQSIS